MATISVPGYPNFKNYTLATFNQSLLINNNLCTLKTCPLVLDGVPLAPLDYLPNIGGNSVYAGIFGLLILVHIPLAIRYRTVGYFIGMLGGLLCELVGYVGRILMHSNPFANSNFVMYICCLTIGPAFFTASIYLCLSRIVVIYSQKAARFQPKTYTFFIFCDIVSLALQGAGGGVAATATTASMNITGKDLLIAGLVFQVVSLSIFTLLCLDLSVAFRNAPLNPAFASLRSSTKFLVFLGTLAGATLFIYVRSCFRVAELSQGFHSSLANSQVTFMILEGAMVVLATFLLTALHPGFVMGKEAWAAANWNAGKAQGGSKSGESSGKRWMFGRKTIINEKVGERDVRNIRPSRRSDAVCGEPA